jgi:hypothetical protein
MQRAQLTAFLVVDDKLKSETSIVGPMRVRRLLGVSFVVARVILRLSSE